MRRCRRCTQWTASNEESASERHMHAISSMRWLILIRSTSTRSRCSRCCVALSCSRSVRTPSPNSSRPRSMCACFAPLLAELARPILVKTQLEVAQRRHGTAHVGLNRPHLQLELIVVALSCLKRVLILFCHSVSQLLSRLWLSRAHPYDSSALRRCCWGRYAAGRAGPAPTLAPACSAARRRVCGGRAWSHSPSGWSFDEGAVAAAADALPAGCELLPAVALALAASEVAATCVAFASCVGFVADGGVGAADVAAPAAIAFASDTTCATEPAVVAASFAFELDSTCAAAAVGAGLAAADGADASPYLPLPLPLLPAPPVTRAIGGGCAWTHPYLALRGAPPWLWDRTRPRWPQQSRLWSRRRAAGVGVGDGAGVEVGVEVASR